MRDFRDTLRRRRRDRTGGQAGRRERAATDARAPRRLLSRKAIFAFLAVMGPGFVAASADNDAGGVTTYSVAGAKYGYALLWTLFLTTFSLAITQEIGARMGAVTQQGLGGLIRERFGVKVTLFAILVMLAANFGTTVAEFAGVAASLEIFGVTKYLSVPFAAVAVYLLMVRGNYQKVERVFIVSGVLYVAYVISGVMAHPDWGASLKNTVVPTFFMSKDYLITFIALVGTTITPWGQFFIQSYVVDKELGVKHLKMERIDVYFGSFLTNFIAFFIVIACAATLWMHHQTINTAQDAAVALRPLAGRFASELFAFGLFNASMLGAAAVPLSSAYSACEAFGFELGINRSFREAPFFFLLYASFIALGALFVMIPRVPLVQLMFWSQALNGVLLPVILVFVQRLVNDSDVMGEYTNSKGFNAVVWVTVAALVVLSMLLVITMAIGLQ